MARKENRRSNEEATCTEVTDAAFLHTVKEAYQEYLVYGARSNAKLKPLHSKIAQDLLLYLNDEVAEERGVVFSAKSLGKEKQKEVKVLGRYHEKKVDIAITKSQQGREEHIVAVINVKMVMSNYSQNKNNYFESMLGETANLRSAECPCFQIVLLPHSLPYFNKEGGISKWERIDQGKMVAYKQLSKDDCTLYFHTPNNTLLYIYNLPFTERIKGWIANTEQPLPKSKDLNAEMAVALSGQESIITPVDSDIVGALDYGGSVIVNNYKLFIEKINYYIKYLHL